MIFESLDTTEIAAASALAGLVIGFLAGRVRIAPRRCRKSASPSSSSSPSRKSGGDEFGGTGEGIELYVGNLSYDMGEDELRKTFGEFGEVLSIRVIKNKFNDRSKGYGFIEMATQSGADKAVKAMNGKEILNRKMVVNEARSKSRD